VQQYSETDQEPTPVKPKCCLLAISFSLHHQQDPIPNEIPQALELARGEQTAETVRREHFSQQSTWPKVLRELWHKIHSLCVI